MILAALLNLGRNQIPLLLEIHFRLMEIIASRLGKKAGLRHTSHFVESASKEWFNSYAVKIVENGNSLINIHRAHRLDAIEKELEIHPDVDGLGDSWAGILSRYNL